MNINIITNKTNILINIAQQPVQGDFLILNQHLMIQISEITHYARMQHVNLIVKWLNQWGYSVFVLKVEFFFFSWNSS